MHSSIIAQLVLFSCICQSHGQHPSIGLDMNKQTCVIDKTLSGRSHFIFRTNHHIVQLYCSANHPIEWTWFNKNDTVYAREDVIDLAETGRCVDNFTNPETYKYYAAISLIYGKPKPYRSLKFACKSMQTPFLQTNIKLLESGSIINLEIDEVPSTPGAVDNPEKSCTPDVLRYGVSESNGQPCWQCYNVLMTPGFTEIQNCESVMKCNFYISEKTKQPSCFRFQRVDGLCQSSTDSEEKKIEVREVGGVVRCSGSYPYRYAHFIHFSTPVIELVPRPIYFNWTVGNMQEMIYIKPPGDLYIGVQKKFVCIASLHYFSMGVWFAIERGTKLSFIQGETNDQNRLRSSGIFESHTTLNISKSLTKIYCYAPIWNSEEWTNTSMDIHVLQGGPPVFVGADQTSYSFALGDQNQTINCDIKGKPLPKVTWLTPPNTTKDLLIEYTNDGGRITFRHVSRSIVGTYICEAESELGFVTRNFTVTIFEPKPISSILLWISIPLLIMFLFIVIIISWRKILQQKRALRILTEREIHEFQVGNPEILKDVEFMDGIAAIEALPYDREKLEIHKDCLKIGHVLGHGTFGIVFHGSINNAAGVKSIAVKTVRPDVDVDDFKALLLEIKIMAYIGTHKNTVNLIGACTDNIRNRQAFIAVELCEGGSLEANLKRSKTNFVNHVKYGEIKISHQEKKFQKLDGQISTFDLVVWAMDIAEGMEYLHSRKVIHGDLATRNVLLGSSNIAKIGDFGLSRVLSQFGDYVKKTHCPLPWRWMAPEALGERRFSIASDMWAYGVTLWELFTLADTPFKEHSYNKEFLEQLRSGLLRLDKPIFSTNNVYEFMVSCWDVDPISRPGFMEIKQIFSNILKSKSLSENYLSLEYEAITDEETPHVYENEMITNAVNLS